MTVFDILRCMLFLRVVGCARPSFALRQTFSALNNNSLWPFAEVSADTERWDDGAQSVSANSSDLYKGSGWLMSKAKYEEMVLTPVKSMDPPLEDGESVFEFGVGLGATFQVLDKHWTDLKLSGSDYSPEAIVVAKKVHPSRKFYQHDISKKLDAIGDGTVDHVISIGALAMYLDWDQMQLALVEAARITKPCGSVVFTNFIEPDGEYRGAIKAPIKKKFWKKYLPSIGLELIATDTVPNQHDRYFLSAKKSCA